MVPPVTGFLERAPVKASNGAGIARMVIAMTLDAGVRSAATSHQENAMALNLAQKKEVVAELANVAHNAHSLVAAEYSGLTVGQLIELRKKARETGVFLRVAKNNLVKRAVVGTDYAGTAEQLVGPLLYAFSMEDPGAAGRLVKDFAKANEQLKAKLVAIGGEVHPASHVDVLASLPTRDEALGMLLSVMSEPATQLVRLLSEPATQITRVIGRTGDEKQAA
jgi:large subunit ribosomal protein L10